MHEGLITGVEFVLYATEEERRAIKVVNLFLECAEAVRREQSHSMLQLTLRGIHKCLPEFARALSLHTEKTAESEWCLYDKRPDGLCPAVTLHGRAYDSGGNIQRVAFILHLLPRSSEEMKGSILQKAEDIGMPIAITTYGRIMARTRELLLAIGEY